MDKKVKNSLKRGKKVAVKRAVNKYASGGMSTAQFLAHGKRQDNLYARALSGNAAKGR